MTEKNEHVWHVRRHLKAREPLLVGTLFFTDGMRKPAFVSNGMHPDYGVHLLADQYVLAESIGETLNFPPNVRSVVVAPSPLSRAVQTARHNFIGMCRSYARDILGIDTENLGETDTVRLSTNGLHRYTKFHLLHGLTETPYRNSRDELDDGNELVALAYDKTFNPDFEGYRFMAQKGFEEDPRSEHPDNVVTRALRDVIPVLLGHDVVLSASHQWNMEAITAALTGNYGTNGNELFERAGGEYGMGHGFELRVYEKGGVIHDAQLQRTTRDPYTLDAELPVDVDVLRKYL